MAISTIDLGEEEEGDYSFLHLPSAAAAVASSETSFVGSFNYFQMPQSYQLLSANCMKQVSGYKRPQ